MDKRSFYAPDIDPAIMAEALTDWYRTQGYQTQVFATQNGVVVQARKESTWRTLAGMSNALTVIVALVGENVEVEVGGAKWAEKAAAGGAGLILLGPIGLIGAGVGTYQQTQLQSQTWQYVDGFIRANSAYASGMPPGLPPVMPTGMQPPMAPQQPMPQQRPPQGVGGATMPPAPINFTVNVGSQPPAAAGNCAQCGKGLRPGAKFCDNCGAPAAAQGQPSNCPSCGRPLRAGAKFCDECGAPVR
ncbi:MAG: zinc ribbon domain-containing protein [Anaerolineae bacterium]